MNEQAKTTICRKKKNAAGEVIGHYALVGGKVKIDISEEVYHTYKKADDAEWEQRRKDIRNGLMSYNELDTDEMLGEDMIPDMDAPSVEEIAEQHFLVERLHRSLERLPDGDRKLIQAIFYDDMSARQYAKALGISHVAVQKRLKVVIGKLKIFMEI